MGKCGHPEITRVKGPVFVDALFVARARNEHVRRVGAQNGHQWCHLWSDDLDSLHELAEKIGMKREWFQDRPGFPHYDLVPRHRAEAIKCGAVERSLLEYLRARRASKKTNHGFSIIS